MAGDLVLHPTHGQAAHAPARMVPKDLGEAIRMAEIISASNLFGCKTPEQAFALMLLADAEGLHPAAAARDYHIMNGKPSLKADAMLGRFQAAGGRIVWIRREDEGVEAKFSHPSSGDVTVCWDKARATRAGLWGSKDTWKKYPLQMLSARVISEGVRASYPSIVSGVYTPEEVQDFGDEPPRDMKRLPEVKPIEPKEDETKEIQPWSIVTGKRH